MSQGCRWLDPPSQPPDGPPPLAERGLVVAPSPAEKMYWIIANEYRDFTTRLFRFSSEHDAKSSYWNGRTCDSQGEAVRTGPSEFHSALGHQTTASRADSRVYPPDAPPGHQKGGAGRN